MMAQKRVELVVRVRAPVGVLVSDLRKMVKDGIMCEVNMRHPEDEMSDVDEVLVMKSRIIKPYPLKTPRTKT